MTKILIRSRALMLAVVVLSLGLVAGCDSEEKSTTPPPPPTGTPPPAQATAKTKIKGSPFSDASKDTARGYKPPQ